MKQLQFPKMLPWEDRIFISHERNMTKSVYTNVMLNGNGWATSSEIAAASLLLDLLSSSHFQPMRKNHRGFGISFLGMFRVFK
jgi:hypothetical protein